MRILLDTNVLLSAALFPNGNAAKAYIKAVTYPNSAVVCEYSVQELQQVFHRKFPDRIGVLELFWTMAASSITIIPTPTKRIPEEFMIRDTKDRPILRAARTSKVDILLTGDKDFLESGIKNPTIMNPTQFLVS